MGGCTSATEATGPVVALKILPPGIGKTRLCGRFAARPRRWPAIIPASVTLYEFGGQSGQFLFPDGIRDGVNLRQLLAAAAVCAGGAGHRAADLPMPAIRPDQASSTGIKPENILLDRRGR